MRERKDEIIPLANDFLKSQHTRLNLTHTAQELLLCYPFRGNVRELIGALGLAVENARGKGGIDREDFPSEMYAHCAFVHANAHPSLREISRCMMRTYVRGVVEDHSGDVKQAAQKLRTSMRTPLYRLLNGKPSSTK